MNFSFKLVQVIFLILALSFLSANSILANWTSDITAPRCTVSFNPASPAILGPTVNVTFSANDDRGGSGVKEITLYKGGAKVMSIQNTNPIQNTSSIYPWITGRETAGSYTFYAIAEDRAGNKNAASSCTNTFTLNPPPSCTNISPGANQLKGCLFDGTNFNSSAGNAPDGSSVLNTAANVTALNYDWVWNSPNVSLVNYDTFSARWRGNFTLRPGIYTFYTESDDGSRVFLTGGGYYNTKIIDDWADHGTRRVNSRPFIFLPNTPVTITVEYYENAGWASAKFGWDYSPPPDVSLTATPASIASGGLTNLTWNITGSATSCTVSNSGTPNITAGFWSGTLNRGDVTAGSHTRSIIMTSNIASDKTFRISCSNSGLTSATRSTSVTVLSPPAVTTNAASSITATSANLNGTVNPRGSQTTAWYRWGTSNLPCADLPNITASSPSYTGASNNSYSRSITGLAAGTTYYFCAAASNSGGAGFGSILSFTTIPPLTLSCAATAGIYAIGDTIPFTASGTGAANGALSWSSPTITSVGASNTNIQFQGRVDAAGTHTLTVRRYGTPTGTVEGSCQVTVDAARIIGGRLSVGLTATPASIFNRQSTNLAWNITGLARSCTLTSSGAPSITAGSWDGTLTGADVTAGSHSRSITMTSANTADKTFAITCFGRGISMPAIAPVTVTPQPPQPFRISSTTSSCYSGRSYINIEWTRSTNATSYNIYRQRWDNPRLRWVTEYAGNTNTLNFPDFDIAQSSPYYYYVIALGLDSPPAWSGWSNLINSQNCNLPPADFSINPDPPQDSCSGNNPYVLVSWERPAGTTASYYYVYRYTVNTNSYQGPLAQIFNPESFFYDYSVTTGYRYKYAVVAVNPRAFPGWKLARNSYQTETNPIRNCIPAPDVSLTAAPASIASGGTTNLTWNITGSATSCTVSNSGTPNITSGSWNGTLSGNDVTAGRHSRSITMTSATVAATADKTFTISCSNSGLSSTTRSTSVTVTPLARPRPFRISSTTSSCLNGRPYINIEWTRSVNALFYNVYRAPGFDYAGTSFGLNHQDFGIVQSTPYAYYVIAVGLDNPPMGSSGWSNITYSRNCTPAPDVSLTAAPASVATGGLTNLTWNITGSATSCTVSNSGAPIITAGSWDGTLTDADVTAGSHSRSITMITSSTITDKTFTISCLGVGGSSATTNSIVNVYIPVPQVITNPATSTTTTATLNGLANPKGGATTGWFRYSTVSPGTCNDTFGTRVPVSGGSSLGSGMTNQIFSQAVSGLTPGSTYYFCAIASNPGGTGYGSVLSFETIPNIPAYIQTKEGDVHSNKSIEGN